MTDVDFLPADQKVVRKQGRERRQSFWLVGIVGCSILLTEGALRLRLRVLRELRGHSTLQSEEFARKSEEIDQLCRHQSDVVQELVRWSAPIETIRATEVLDVVLEARSESIYLERVEWDGGGFQPESAVLPSLRITGAFEELGDVVDFSETLKASGRLPELAVRQSGAPNSSGGRQRPSFVIETKRTGGGR